MRLRAALALIVGFGLPATQSFAADEWGGSVAATSEYYVRGISRTSGHAALQLDLHYSNPDGFVAGVFASNSQIDPKWSMDVELNGFLGFVWNIDDAWRARVLANYYAYPWNHAGSHYNYEELDLDVSYQGWLHFDLGYSPNSPRFLPYPYSGLTGVNEESVEVSAQRQIFGKFSLIGGVGYSFLGGPDSGGYTYWSAGAAYDFRAFSVAVAYLNTSGEAKSLFPKAAATGDWAGTIIWRF